MIGYDKILLPLLDFFQQTSISRYYKFYSKSGNWDKEKIKRYQLARLKELLIYSRDNVPYYRDLFSGIKLDIEGMASLEQLECIPVLTREEIQANQEKLISSRFDKANLHKGSSSGTTGIPITYFKDNNGYSSGMAAGYYGYTLSGWQPGRKTLHIWGNPSSIIHWNTIKSRLKVKLKNQTNIASTVFNDPAKHHDTYKFIAEEGFDYIDGYTSAIYELAKIIEKNNYKRLNAKCVFTTAENIYDYQRELIEKFIGPVSDDYGCGEINSIAMRPSGEDRYYIFDTHVIVEVEESSRNNSSIIVTDLDNLAMPFIRYKPGDLIQGLTEPEQGDKLQFNYFKKIIGRESDIITLPNGKKILPVNILGGTLFRDIGGITKHKVIWDGRELTFQFQTANGFNLQKADSMIHNEFRDYGVPIKIELKDLLPDKNGKFKYFEILKSN